MKSKLITLLLCTLLLATCWAHPNHDDGHTEWIPRAELQQLFPQATDFTPMHIGDTAKFGANVQKKLNKKLAKDELEAPLFKVYQGTKPVGYAWAGIANFKASPGMVLVGVDTRDRIVGVLLPECKLAVARPPFLTQFKGKRSSDAFVIGKDLKTTGAPAGETTELARTVRQGVVVLSQARLD